MNQYFKNMEEEWIAFLSETIATKPLSGEEKGCADIYMKALEEIGAEHYRDEAGNVIGVIRGTGEGPNIVSNGHMDVVPEGNLEAWEDLDPFQAVVKDGEIYGRGSADMLSGLSVQFFAFREIKKLVDKGAKLSGDLTFTAVVHEEPAESAGAICLYDKSFPKYNLKADLVYLGEPTNNNLKLGQRGKVELVIDVYGKVAHSSAPWRGISAVEKAQPVIQAILNNFYETSVTHEKLGFSAMTITDVVVSPGKMYSCVPDHCEITVDRRYVPPMTIESCIAQVQKFLDYLSEKDPDFKAEVHQRINHRVCYTGYETDVAKQHPAWIDDRDNPLIDLTFEVLRGLGQDPKEEYKLAGTDGSISCGVHKIPTIIYSPAEEAYCHKAKEHLNIEKALNAIEGYTALYCKIFGLDFEQFCDK